MIVFSVNAMDDKLAQFFLLTIIILISSFTDLYWQVDIFLKGSVLQNLSFTIGLQGVRTGMPAGRNLVLVVVKAHLHNARHRRKTQHPTKYLQKLALCGTECFNDA